MAEQELWTIQEFHEHEEARLYSVDLEVFIEFLIEKGFIKVIQSDSKNEFIFHRDYRAG